MRLCDAGSNDIRSEGVRHLSRAIPNSVIEHLELGTNGECDKAVAVNKIDSDGAILLFKALKNQGHITYLGLSNNCIGPSPAAMTACAKVVSNVGVFNSRLKMLLTVAKLYLAPTPLPWVQFAM